MYFAYFVKYVFLEKRCIGELSLIRSGLKRDNVNKIINLKKKNSLREIPVPLPPSSSHRKKILSPDLKV